MSHEEDVFTGQNPFGRASSSHRQQHDHRRGEVSPQNKREGRGSERTSMSRAPQGLNDDYSPSRSRSRSPVQPRQTHHPLQTPLLDHRHVEEDYDFYSPPKPGFWDTHYVAKQRLQASFYFLLLLLIFFGGAALLATALYVSVQAMPFIIASLAGVSALAALPHALLVLVGALPLIGVSFIAWRWIAVHGQELEVDENKLPFSFWILLHRENIPPLTKAYLSNLKNAVLWSLVSKTDEEVSEEVNAHEMEESDSSGVSFPSINTVVIKRDQRAYNSLRDRGLYATYLQEKIDRKSPILYLALFILLKHAKYRTAAFLAALGLGSYLAQALVPFIVHAAISTLGLPLGVGVLLGIFATAAIVAMTYQVLSLATLISDIYKAREKLLKKSAWEQKVSMNYRAIGYAVVGALGLGFAVYASTLFFAPLVQVLTPILGAGMATFSALAVSVSLAVLCMRTLPSVAEFVAKPVTLWKAPKNNSEDLGARNRDLNTTLLMPSVEEGQSQPLRSHEVEPQKASRFSCWPFSKKENQAQGQDLDQGQEQGDRLRDRAPSMSYPHQGNGPENH